MVEYASRRRSIGHGHDHARQIAGHVVDGGGVAVPAFGVDGDVDAVRQIYGDKTMDLTNLVDIPKVLSGLVKRYVIK